MKKYILIIISLIIIGNRLYGFYTLPENIYSGYGYVAGVNNINALFVNPANLFHINSDEMYITFNEPFSFYSFAAGFPIFQNQYVGVGFLSTLPVDTLKIGVNFLDAEYIKLGLTTGIDHQKLPSDKIGLSFTPGLTALIIKDENINFNLAFAATYQNLIAINSFTNVNDESSGYLNLGLRNELFIKNLFLNLGTEYIINKFNFSASMEYYLFNFMNIGLTLKNSDLAIGTSIYFKNHFIAISYQKNLLSIGYCFSLSDSAEGSLFEKKVHKNFQLSRVISQGTLDKQKELLDEGVKLYKDQKYDEAKKVWIKVINLAPETEYAKEAKNYITKVNNILENVNK